MEKLFYWPVTRRGINQYFGENKACIDLASGTKTIACDGLNPPAGYKSVYSMMKGHNALDLYAERWQPVYAAREGFVREVETETSRGLGIGIEHDFGAKGRWKTRYWHLVALDAHYGDYVYTGQLIGYADSTGYSNGDHLHFEVKPLNSDGTNAQQNNGYFGAIDPLPLMFDDLARDVNTSRKMIESIAAWLDAFTDRLRAVRT
jgi:murein DD-endopeptidase MepM/ murein hydrolase activator NlpD